MELYRSSRQMIRKIMVEFMVRFHPLLRCKLEVLKLKFMLKKQFSDDSTFVTGETNGTVSLWKDKKVVNKVKLFNDWTLVFAKNNVIFAASAGDGIVVLSNDLWGTETYPGRQKRPVSIDANEKFLVVGYHEKHVFGTGSSIIVQERKRGYYSQWSDKQRHVRLFYE